MAKRSSVSRTLAPPLFDPQTYPGFLEPLAETWTPFTRQFGQAAGHVPAGAAAPEQPPSSSSVSKVVPLQIPGPGQPVAPTQDAGSGDTRVSDPGGLAELIPSASDVQITPTGTEPQSMQLPPPSKPSGAVKRSVGVTRRVVNQMSRSEQISLQMARDQVSQSIQVRNQAREARAATLIQAAQVQKQAQNFQSGEQARTQRTPAGQQWVARKRDQIQSAGQRAGVALAQATKTFEQADFAVKQGNDGLRLMVAQAQERFESAQEHRAEIVKAKALRPPTAEEERAKGAGGRAERAADVKLDAEKKTAWTETRTDAIAKMKAIEKEVAALQVTAAGGKPAVKYDLSKPPTEELFPDEEKLLQAQSLYERHVPLKAQRDEADAYLGKRRRQITGKTKKVATQEDVLAADRRSEAFLNGASRRFRDVVGRDPSKAELAKMKGIHSKGVAANKPSVEIQRELLTFLRGVK